MESPSSSRAADNPPVTGPRKGDTFLIPSERAGGKKHLHVAVTDPIVPAGAATPEILLLSISSIRPGDGYDRACILKPGDHPFIKRDSYVVYYLAEARAVRQLQADIKRMLAVPKKRMDADVVARMAAGIEKSRYSKNHILKFYREARAR